MLWSSLGHIPILTHMLSLCSIKLLFNHKTPNFAAIKAVKALPSQMSLPAQCHTKIVPLSTYNWGQDGPFKFNDRLPFNPVVYNLIASFHAITFWVCFELTIHLFSTFKQRGSMYFWYVSKNSYLYHFVLTIRSILLTTWAIVMITIFEDLVIFVVPLSAMAVFAFQRVFAAFVYSGFSMVLYSRLHLVTQDSRLLRTIFWTIVATGVAFNVPSILNICIPSTLRDGLLFKMFSGTDIAFTLQDIILGSMYLYLFNRFARGGSLERRDRETMTLLIIAQMVILITDAASTILIYMHFYVLRLTITTLHLRHQAQARVCSSEPALCTEKFNASLNVGESAHSRSSAINSKGADWLARLPKFTTRGTRIAALWTEHGTRGEAAVDS